MLLQLQRAFQTCMADADWHLPTGLISEELREAGEQTYITTGDTIVRIMYELMLPET
jgi:hypothetical protein